MPDSLTLVPVVSLICAQCADILLTWRASGKAKRSVKRELAARQGFELRYVENFGRAGNPISC